MPGAQPAGDRRLSDPLAGLPPLREVIARHGLDARKSLGQHFLLDLNLTGRIARAAGDLSTGTTIEIGPGPGGLTRALLAAGAAQVIAVERDRRAVDALSSLVAASGGRLELREADAMTVDAATLGAPPRRIVANLPYNIATPLLLGWLRRIDAFAVLILMFQKEVAERLAAAPGEEAYGRLAVAAQWRATVRRLFDIDRRAFVPPPKVTSSVVEIVPRAEPLAPADPAVLEAVTAAAFGQRRKMLRSSLRSLGVDPNLLCARAGIASDRRAETIDIPGFCALARALTALRAGA